MTSDNWSRRSADCRCSGAGGRSDMPRCGVVDARRSVAGLRLAPSAWRPPHNSAGPTCRRPASACDRATDRAAPPCPRSRVASLDCRRAERFGGCCRVIAGPITQVPTNMPTATAAMAARQRFGPERRRLQQVAWKAHACLRQGKRLMRQGQFRARATFLRGRLASDLRRRPVPARSRARACGLRSSGPRAAASAAASPPRSASALRGC